MVSPNVVDYGMESRGSPARLRDTIAMSKSAMVIVNNTGAAARNIAVAPCAVMAVQVTQSLESFDEYHTLTVKIE